MLERSPEGGGIDESTREPCKVPSPLRNVTKRRHGWNVQKEKRKDEKLGDTYSSVIIRVSIPHFILVSKR